MCEFTKRDGTKCKANAMNGSDYCYRHDKNIPDEEKKRASARGGEANRHINGVFKEIAIERPEDVKALLVDTIQNVRSGNMEIKTANCLGFLSSHLIRAFELTELEKRIETIEKLINK